MSAHAAAAGRPLLGRSASASSTVRRRIASRRPLVVNNFITVEQGLKKVKHMLDFGKDKRLQVLHKLYGELNEASLREVLDDDFVMVEKELGKGSKFTYGKEDYVSMMTKVVLPAIPDFTWGHLTNADVDDDGFCIVTVKASGRHTGTAFALPGYTAIPPSGGRFTLAQETHRVRVAGNKVTHVIALPSMDAGPRALYDALEMLSKGASL